MEASTAKLVGMGSVLLLMLSGPAVAFPLDTDFVNDARCASLANMHIRDEVWANPAAPGDFAADATIAASSTNTTFSACGITGTGAGGNDWLITITNLTDFDIYAVFFVVDPGGSVGNADGTIGGNDAFMIATYGANQNLVSESMDLDGLFQPGETWQFVALDFVPSTGSAPVFSSRGIGSASTGLSGSNASIVTPEPSTFALTLSGLLALGLMRRRRARRHP